MSYQPDELLAMEREEEDARLRFEEARDSGKTSGEEDHGLLERLEAEWKRALDRLNRARGSNQS
jgi:hypothetical protein